MKTLAVVALSMLVVAAAGELRAEDRPVQLALFDPIQIFPANYSISGVRLSLLYGRNVSVTGIDIGLVNSTTGGTSKGLQYGIVGINEGSFVGWQADWVSLTTSNFEGLQTGLYTQSGHVSGVQIGLINNTGTMNGIQLGVINIIKSGGFMPVFPIVNWSFK